MGECAYRAGKLADPHLFGRAVEAFDIALHLGIPVREFETKSDRLRVNAVGPADHGGVFKFPGALFEYLLELPKIGGYGGRGLFDEESLRSINHVVGGQSVMKPA